MRSGRVTRGVSWHPTGVRPDHLAALTALPALALTAWLALTAAPFPADRLARDDVEGVHLLDRHDRPLRHVPGAAGRGAWRSLADLGPWVPAAFVAVEDRRFFAHPGVDLRGIARAAWANLLAGRVVAGGSTITQQVVQLVAPQPRTLAGKAVEALLAVRLERAATKATLLEHYVNRAPFGHGAVGVEAAARLYLDRPARTLTLAEAALLAGVPQAPTLNNPRTDPARADARRRRVLAAMRATGVIDAAVEAEARASTARLDASAAPFAAPHFAAWALAQPESVGVVPTTLDLDLQVHVEDAVAVTVRALADRHVTQGAAVVLDNATGDVLAWVGSRDFFDAAEGQNDMVVGLRQPGSTLKPFVYGLALEDGLTAATPLPDLPLFVPTLIGDYRPRNYDRRYHGWVSLRAALANSYNVPAVLVAHRVGVGRLLASLRDDLGFASLTDSATHYGVGLALGNGEVRLLELANAYRALANDGVWSPVRWRRDRPAPTGRRVMPAAIARLLTDILADPVARSPAFGRGGALEAPFPAAVKTGTSADFTDNWTVGFTRRHTVAAWTGNFDGRPMERVSGVTGAGPLWARVVRAATTGAPGGFARAGLERHRVCPDPPACDGAYDELFVPGTAPDGPTTPPLPRGVRVVFPDTGDVFQRDVDAPPELARIRLRADAPADVEALVFAVDGEVMAPVGRPFRRWWTLQPGRHTLRAWPVGAPGAAGPAVTFEVLE